MATANSTGVRSHADHRTATSVSLSSADRAAHDAASHVRPYLSPAGREALRRLEADRTRTLRRQFDAALVERGMNEYHEWAAEVAA
jgi:hypothetical protein